MAEIRKVPNGRFRGRHRTAIRHRLTGLPHPEDRLRITGKIPHIGGTGYRHKGEIHVPSLRLRKHPCRHWLARGKKAVPCVRKRKRSRRRRQRFAGRRTLCGYTAVSIRSCWGSFYSWWLSERSWFSVPAIPTRSPRAMTCCIMENASCSSRSRDLHSWRYCLSFPIASTAIR